VSDGRTVDAAAERRDALVAAIDDFAARLNRGVHVRGAVVLRQLVDEAMLAAQSHSVLAPDTDADADGNADEELHALISERGPDVGPLYEYASVLVVGAICHEIEKMTGISPAELLAPLRSQD
jgi:hypothetical protein